MKTYHLLALLSFLSCLQAQPSFDSSIYSYYQEDKLPNQHHKQVNSSEKKSTPAKDAIQTEDNYNQENENQKKKEEKPTTPHTFTGNVSLVSDYRFRGISQTMRRPAIQGGFDYAYINGLYLGTWASNVDGTAHFYNNTSMEWDLYGGYKSHLLPCIVPDLTYNMGFLYYYYPGGKTHARQSVPYNTCEFYLELIYKGLSIKYWQTLTDYFGISSHNPPTNHQKNYRTHPNGSSRGSIYIEGNLTFDLLKKVCLGGLEAGKLNLYLHIGHQTVRHYKRLSYTDWRTTLTQEFNWFNFFISYVATDAKHAYYDVPDHAFHPKKRHLGVQGVVIGMIRTF